MPLGPVRKANTFAMQAPMITTNTAIQRMWRRESDCASEAIEVLVEIPKILLLVDDLRAGAVCASNCSRVIGARRDSLSLHVLHMPIQETYVAAALETGVYEAGRLHRFCAGSSKIRTGSLRSNP